MQKQTIAVIFAGGKSSRMSTDKSLLPFGEFKTLTEFQYNRLSKIFDKVYISCKSNKFDFNANLIFDRYKESSPLVGIISIFETLDVDEVFIISVDSPFIDIDIIKELKLNNQDEYDIIVSSTEGKNQPLCAIYKRSILSKAKEFLSKDIHKLNFLIKNLNSKIVEFKNDDRFTNLNYYNEYLKAYKLK